MQALYSPCGTLHCMAELPDPFSVFPKGISARDYTNQLCVTMAKFIETYQGGKAIVYMGYKFTKGKKESVKDLSTCV